LTHAHFGSGPGGKGTSGCSSVPHALAQSLLGSSDFKPQE